MANPTKDGGGPSKDRAREGPGEASTVKAHSDGPSGSLVEWEVGTQESEATGLGIRVDKGIEEVRSGRRIWSLKGPGCTSF